MKYLIVRNYRANGMLLPVWRKSRFLSPAIVKTLSIRELIPVAFKNLLMGDFYSSPLEKKVFHLEWHVCKGPSAKVKGK